MELRTTGSPQGRRLDRAEYLKVLTSLRIVGVDAWLGAMPASAVLPVDPVKVVTEMLRGVPVPPGFDPASLSAGDAVRDRYQLGAGVTGAVGCAWVDRWIGGDDHAAEAMATSHTWPILLEMRDQGGWSEVYWELADSMTGRGAIDVRGTYREGLGC